jgi:hypothetical protein
VLGTQSLKGTEKDVFLTSQNFSTLAKVQKILLLIAKKCQYLLSVRDNNCCNRLHVDTP